MSGLTARLRREADRALMLDLDVLVAITPREAIVIGELEERYGVGVLAIADGAAGIIGSWDGRMSYRIWAVRLWRDRLSFFIIASALTFIEASLSWGLDNVCLPVFTGLLFEAGVGLLKA